MSSAPYEIKPVKTYERKLAKLPPQIQNRITRAVKEKLVLDPYGESFPLQGIWKDMKIRKFRVGDYRVKSVIEERIVWLLEVDYRKSA